MLVALATVTYVAIMALAPALHHDFQCHVQHPGHCDACRALASAPDPAGLAATEPQVPARSATLTSSADLAHVGVGRRVAGDRAPPSAA